MTEAPAMWRIWGSRRYSFLTRLPRYWFALLACRRKGCLRNMKYSNGQIGCGRCHRRADGNVSGEED